MEEVWKDIPGYEGRYQASTSGRIKRLKYVSYFDKIDYHSGEIVHAHTTFPEMIRKSYIDKLLGYCRIELMNPITNERDDWLVHRLIATTFIPNPDNLPQVNHKDHDKFNNCVDNLEWCTCSYNVKYSYDKNVQIMSSTRKRNIGEALEVELICNETEEHFSSYKDAINKMNVTSDYLQKVLYDEASDSSIQKYGCTFRFADTTRYKRGYRGNRSNPFKCVETNQVYTSIRECSEILQLSQPFIKRCLTEYSGRPLYNRMKKKSYTLEYLEL